MSQRNKIKKESQFDKNFKENHPFQPKRVTKLKDLRFANSKKRENSKQRADRMYDEWRQRDEKIAIKRKEL